MFDFKNLKKEIEKSARSAVNEYLEVGKIKRTSKVAFRHTMEDLGESFTKIINTPGYFPEYTGDIVDTGALRDSQKIIFKGGVTVTFAWPVPYSYYVHFGYTHRSGRYFPGRPWTEHGLGIFDMSGRFLGYFFEEYITPTKKKKK